MVTSSAVVGSSAIKRSGLLMSAMLWERQGIRTYRRYDTVRRRWTKPKTEDSIRFIPVDFKVIEILRNLKSIQEELLPFYGLENPDNVVFF